MMLCAGGCRSSRQAVTASADTLAVSHVAALIADSVAVRVVIALDSPEISLEYPDTPRRSVKLKAARMRVVSSRASLKKTATVARDSVAASARHKAMAASHQAETPLRWPLLAAAAFLIFLFYKSLARHLRK